VSLIFGDAGKSNAISKRYYSSDVFSYLL